MDIITMSLRVIASELTYCEAHPSFKKYKSLTSNEKNGMTILWRSSVAPADLQTAAYANNNPIGKDLISLAQKINTICTQRYLKRRSVRGKVRRRVHLMLQD